MKIEVNGMTVHLENEEAKEILEALRDSIMKSITYQSFGEPKDNKRKKVRIKNISGAFPPDGHSKYSCVTNDSCEAPIGYIKYSQGSNCYYFESRYDLSLVRQELLEIADYIKSIKTR